MVDQSKITSGFDLELLLSERYIQYFLLTSFETGSMPWYMQDTDPDTGVITHIMIHPPVELEQNRLYEPRDDFVAHPFPNEVPIVFTNHGDACKVELLPDDQEADIRVTLIVSVVGPPLLPGGNPLILTEQDMTLDAKFFIASDIDANGTQKDVRFTLEVVDINGPFLDKAKTLKRVKEEVDRDIPLTIFGEDSSIMQIESQKFFAEQSDDPPTCLGLYVNLNLKNGPEPDAFFPARGDLAQAKNFMPKGHHLAFGFSGDLYPRLGSDIFQRMASPKEGGGFFYPLDPDNPGMGHIKSAVVFPQANGQHVPLGTAATQFDNILNIQVKGELDIDTFFMPDFRMTISLVPVIDNGVLTFRPRFDLNIPAAGWLIVGSALLSFLTLKLAIPLTLALLAAKAIIEDLGEEMAVPLIEAKLEDASFVDSFPNKLPVEKRHWDPAYTTEHQIVSLVKEVPINNEGLAFAAFDLRIGKEPKILKNAVIRSEVRDDAGNVSGLLYRINDWSRDFEKELDLIFPATDRLGFVEILPPQGGVESFRVHLTVDQAVERIKTKRLIDKIAYRPYKIDEVENQIYQILTLSDVEAEEIRQLAAALLRRDLVATKDAEFRQQAHDQLLAELGREPTPEEVGAVRNILLEAAVEALFSRKAMPVMSKPFNPVSSLPAIVIW